MGLESPRAIEVPLLSPCLSSLWVRFVTRAKWSVAREVVVGLTEDLLAKDSRFWRLAAGHSHLMSFGDAARLAAPAARTPPLVFASIAVWIVAAGFAGVLGAWVAIGGVAVGLGMAVLLLDRSASVLLLQPSPRLVLLGAIVGGSMAAATYLLLYPLLMSILPDIGTDAALLYAAFRAPPAALYALACAPLGSPVLVAVALVCGLAWGALSAATASLVPTLVAHLVWDAFVLLWLPLVSN